MIRSILPRAWKRYVIVVLLSIPFAFGLRAGLEWVLAPTLAERSEAYVRKQNVHPLSEPLTQILSESRADAPTQEHSLLGHSAPDFTLSDDTGQLVRLTDKLQRGPVVVVFYYGYYCPHCVSQLFALNKDIALFHELGVEVVAISADPPAETGARFREFGRFQFPVLSDPENRVAEAFGVYTRPTADQPESLEHGTFVVAPDGGIRWAYRGTQPFFDAKTLLRESARCGSRAVASIK